MSIGVLATLFAALVVSRLIFDVLLNFTGWKKTSMLPMAVPGLVLGLIGGGSVRGMAYEVSGAIWPEVYAYLLEREQPTETYIEQRVQVRLGDGRKVEALTFLSDRGHPQWAGNLSLDAQAALIAGATGLSGRNTDYLRDLVGHLREAGARDRVMEALLTRVERLGADR
jgi:cation transport protein ChaC